MSIEVKVPLLPESITDATVLTWHKQIGESVKREETLVDLETDKVVLEVPAPQDGIIKKILCPQGTIVKANQILAHIEASKTAEKRPDVSKTSEQKIQTTTNKKSEEPREQMLQQEALQPSHESTDKLTGPAVRRILSKFEVSPEQVAGISGSGKHGRITRQDILNYVQKKQEAAPQSKGISQQETQSQPDKTSNIAARRQAQKVPMTRIRAKIAERLLQAQHNAAILTTFNEVNLKSIMEVRNKYKENFEKKHGVKLGFMSFFTKAVVESLKHFPAVNASIDGEDIIYHNYYDIGIAVSTERGLVVPILRDADQMNMSDIEKKIGDMACKARQGKLAIEEMQGGTFTITNGGVFGSLLATPIINPPQTAILGMHKIEDRAVVEKNEIVIRPMMYVALSYDHRLIDGRESVQFLVNVKEYLEDPLRLLLDL